MEAASEGGDEGRQRRHWIPLFSHTPTSPKRRPLLGSTEPTICVSSSRASPSPRRQPPRSPQPNLPRACCSLAERDAAQTKKARPPHSQGPRKARAAARGGPNWPTCTPVKLAAELQGTYEDKTSRPCSIIGWPSPQVPPPPPPPPAPSPRSIHFTQ